MSSERAVFMHKDNLPQRPGSFVSLLLWGVGPWTKGSCMVTLSFPRHCSASSPQRRNLSGTLGTPPGLLRSIKNRVCPCRQQTLKCKGKLSKQQFRRHNSALNIYSEERSGHLIALSQDKHMLCVPLHNCSFCLQCPLQWTFGLVCGHPASECSSYESW